MASWGKKLNSRGSLWTTLPSDGASPLAKKIKNKDLGEKNEKNGGKLHKKCGKKHDHCYNNLM